MNNITAVEIMDAADEEGVEISCKTAAMWLHDVENMTDFEAWTLIWNWIYDEQAYIEAEGLEAEAYEYSMYY